MFLALLARIFGGIWAAKGRLCGMPLKPIVRRLGPESACCLQSEIRTLCCLNEKFTSSNAAADVALEPCVGGDAMACHKPWTLPYFFRRPMALLRAAARDDAYGYVGRLPRNGQKVRR